MKSRVLAHSTRVKRVFVCSSNNSLVLRFLSRTTEDRERGEKVLCVRVCVPVCMCVCCPPRAAQGTARKHIGITGSRHSVSHSAGTPVEEESTERLKYRLK